MPYTSPYTPDQIRAYGDSLTASGGSLTDFLNAANQYGVSFDDLSGAYGMSPLQGAQYIASQQGGGGGGSNEYDYMNFSSPGSEDLLNDRANAIQDHYTQALTQQWLPAIQSQAIGTGGLGGTRQGVAQGVALGNAATGYADSLSNMYLDAYQGDANRALANQGQWLGYDVSSRNADRGDFLAGLSALGLSSELPWSGFGNVSSLLNGASGSNYSTTGGTSGGGGWTGGLLGGLTGLGAWGQYQNLTRGT